MAGKVDADFPYLRGVADAWAGKPGPAFPMPDSSWAHRLYARGWSDAMDEKLKAAKIAKASPHGR